MTFLPQLIGAMMWVESGNDAMKIGDSGMAYGALQIHEAVVDDVNRIYGTDYLHVDCLNRDRSEIICALYLLHYAGPAATPERCARIWNGGPRGAENAATLSYWEKVQQHMFSLRKADLIPGA